MLLFLLLLLVVVVEPWFGAPGFAAAAELPTPCTVRAAAAAHQQYSGHPKHPGGRQLWFALFHSCILPVHARTAAELPRWWPPQVSVDLADIANPHVDESTNGCHFSPLDHQLFGVYSQMVRPPCSPDPLLPACSLQSRPACSLQSRPACSLHHH